MPRSLRIEKQNAVYHIINRGNYRQDLFTDDGTHKSFEECLFEACVKCGWILEGFCVMTNHFHLVVRTPKGNLVYGMKWLQSTFANRYHRFRKIHGKLFQGRYKSLIVEEETYLGSLLHYTHLNPVRAEMTDIDGLKSYRWSSYWYLHRPSLRPDFLRCESALSAAGALVDTRIGHQKYAQYLQWLASDEKAQKEMNFKKMCRGWALGSKDFKKQLIHESMQSADAEEDQKEKSEGIRLRYEGASLQEANELHWELVMEKCMAILEKSNGDCRKDAKSAEWKVMIAAVLKQETSATNVWIAKHLNMGVSQAVSRYVSIHRKSKNECKIRDLIARITE